MVSSVANNSAAIAAAIKGAEDQLVGAALQKRRSASLKHGGTGGPENATFGQETGVVDETGRTGDLLDHREGLAGESEYAVDGSIIIDEHTNFANSGGPKARARRASEGAHLSRREGKRASGEVRCEKCGKGYKHSSCLTKHLSVHPSLRLCSLNPGCSHPEDSKLNTSSCHTRDCTQMPLLTLIQVGAYARVDVYFKAPHFKASTSSTA